MHVTAHLDVDLVALESEDAVTCLLNLAAPLLDGDLERPGQTLVVVLDRSGSMIGPNLDMAKTGLRGLVRRLAPQDRFALVTFDQEAQLVVPLRTMAEHDLSVIDSLIAAINPGGTTDLWAGYNLGLREAVRAISDTSDDDAVVAGATVMLVSDGHANAGNTNPRLLGERALSAFKSHAITTLTIGLGLGYDEVLLAAISDGGSGEHCFAANADELPAVLDQQVEGLLEKSVLSATVRITGREGILTSVSTLQGLPTWTEGDTIVIALGDFYAGETRKTLVKLGVASIPALGLATIADVVLEYTALPEQLEHSVTLPICVNVVPGDVAAKRVPMPEVVVQKLLLEASQARESASESLRAGDSAAARVKLGRVSADLSSARATIDSQYQEDKIDQSQIYGLRLALDSESTELAAAQQMAEQMPMEFTSKSMIHMASASRRGRSTKSRRDYDSSSADGHCSICGAPLLPIMYGMPAGSQEGVILGGCIIRSDNPTVGCKACGWRGHDSRTDESV